MNVLISLLIFLSGVVTGSTVTYLTMKSNVQFNKYWIATLVTILWAASVIVELIVIDYVVPVAVHGLMGVIAGHFFYEKKFKEDKQ